MKQAKVYHGDSFKHLKSSNTSSVYEQFESYYFRLGRKLNAGWYYLSFEMEYDLKNHLICSWLAGANENDDLFFNIQGENSLSAYNKFRELLFNMTAKDALLNRQSYMPLTLICNYFLKGYEFNFIKLCSASEVTRMMQIQTGRNRQ